MTTHAEHHWPARPGHVREIADFVAREAFALGASDEEVNDLRLVAEEVAANIVRYGYADGDEGQLTVRVDADPPEVRLTITDDAACYALDQIPRPDVEAPLSERPIGGLGWHLIRHLVDEVRHRPLEPRGNELILTRRLGRRSPPSGSRQA